MTDQKSDFFVGQTPREIGALNSKPLGPLRIGTVIRPTRTYFGNKMLPFRQSKKRVPDFILALQHTPQFFGRDDRHIEWLFVRAMKTCQSATSLLSELLQNFLQFFDNLWIIPIKLV